MKSNTLRKKERFKKSIPLILMVLPGVIALIAFNYVPMFGTVLAFKDFSYRDGIFGSEWVGMKNFEYIFSSGEIVRTIGNTVLYHLAFNITITLGAVVVSVMLYFIQKKRATDFFQRTTVIPNLVSYTVIAFIVNILLSNEKGLINTILNGMGKESISWYTTPVYWPFILVIVNMWFGVGVKAIYYYASMMTIDKALFEAADLDGATKWDKTVKIILPSIAPTICIFLIMDLGKILMTNFSLFYSVPMNSEALYSVTDVLSTYEYRGLMFGDIGTTTALGLFTGVVTAVMTLSINAVVKRVSPENSML